MNTIMNMKKVIEKAVTRVILMSSNLLALDLLTMTNKYVYNMQIENKIMLH